MLGQQQTVQLYVPSSALWCLSNILLTDIGWEWFRYQSVVNG